MQRLFSWLVLWCLVAGTAHAADIGGWFEQQSRSDPAAQQDDCPALVAATADSEATTDAAQRYYAIGLCYLHSSKIARDPVAAAAWLTKAAELEHPLARRALMSLRERGNSHPSGQHCHDLGMGRRLCHGQ
jgi:TPR repeat protein